ncbi:hypothetical protein H072_3435 [Dactylellina haptotyla CBS 200.50]|uniref:CsbD-like domain-containing protein n=1 Tax=Dactylellina haptotyla (strain CBS 200.50) TaxID=1284197 RepID=S8AI59_DACHA|nr:hypothetical protein H072_3435 [Dactylellina haptotyla CBS 200.50]
MASNDTSSDAEPSQVTGGLTQLQGTIETVIGNITGADSWKEAGEEHQLAGTNEIEDAQKNARKEAREDRIHGKIDSMFRYCCIHKPNTRFVAVMVDPYFPLDSSKQTQGNLQAERAEWKKAVEGNHQLPEVSAERMDAKIKTAVGMVTGGELQAAYNTEVLLFPRL